MIIPLVFENCENPQRISSRGFPILTGPCLGQQTPREEPVLFAPGIVTSGMYTRDVSMTPDGKYFFFMSTHLNSEIEVMGKNLSLWQLQKLFGQPENGNAGIYWMKADFIERLRPEGF